MAALRRSRAAVRGYGYSTFVAGLALSFAGCGPDSPTAPSPSSPLGAAPSAATHAAVLVGAGDIASCGSDLPNAEATAKLLDAIDGTVFTAGDNAYNSGSEEQFRECFEPTWGRHKGRTRPSPGNHDYGTPGAGSYFQYFGASAGPPGAGYYSFDIGGWHVVSLNSNVSMEPGSPQADWLRQDLESRRSRCTAAYWHHPLQSSGAHGGTGSVRNAWNVLYEFGAELVINAHDHIFERFAPQDPSGSRDPARGIVQFTVGTGGGRLTRVKQLQPNSAVQGISYGVLELTLRSDGYDWRFVPVAGNSFSDSGTGSCH